jgi:large subunit ribosomal protein L32
VQAPTRSECPNCGAFRLPHRVCPECGYYDEKPVVSIKEKKSSAE